MERSAIRESFSCQLRMILSENRWPFPDQVEDMLFGIMR